MAPVLSNLERNADFLSVISRRKKPGEHKKLINAATDDEINACCEVYLNALRGRFDLTPKIAKQLETKHRKNCAILVDPTVPTSKKRKILISQSGGFLGGLLGAIVGPAIKGIAGGIAGAIQSQRRHRR
jgi:hypothetical protein